MSRGPLFLGDVGHCLARLGRARATSRREGFDVKEVLYPGFEGRPASTSLDEFFEAVELQVDIYRLSHKKRLVYATGFGSLVLLGLRARGNVPDLPAVIQGAIPWGDVRARQPGDPAAGERERTRFADPRERDAFIEEHLASPMEAAELNAFFAGYATCTALPRIHEWFDASWLAALEGALAARPPAIDGIRVWTEGASERPLDAQHAEAVRALGADWPTERAAGWRRYPYLDLPGEWVGAVGGFVA